MKRTIATALFLVLVVVSHLAPAQGTAARFDHLTTGFELTGAHRLQACESCHVSAVFKGTPRTCFGCHAQGSRIGATHKPPDHVMSSEQCAACDSTAAWVPAVRFDHEQALGGCSSCHNSASSPGKPVGHIETTMECNACHGTVVLESVEIRPLGCLGQLRVMPRRQSREAGAAADIGSAQVTGR